MFGVEGRLCSYLDFFLESIKCLFLWLQQENKGLREILQITRESFLNLKKEDASESTSLSGLVTSSDLSLRKS